MPRTTLLAKNLVHGGVVCTLAVVGTGMPCKTKPYSLSARGCTTRAHQLLSTVVLAVFAIWFPTMAFVVIGFDHCIANMYYGTLGLMLDVPGKDFWYDFMWKNIVPATIGNTFGGAVMVGAFYWYASRFP
eukprot:4821394-Pyramimonas_sp.AAC.1